VRCLAGIGECPNAGYRCLNGGIQFHEGALAVLPPLVDNLEDISPGVLEEDERAIAQFQFHERLFLEESGQPEGFLAGLAWLRLRSVVLLLNDEGIEEISA
jgi:hypothetical protein